MRPGQQPNRLGRWLLRLRAGAERRAEIEDDLAELFRLRAAERGGWYAQWRWLLDAASVTPSAMAPSRRWRTNPMDAIWQDLRAGIRALAASRRFTAIAVVVLALGIGVTTAVFSVVNAVLLRPLPYADPDRLVAVTGLFTSGARQAPTRVIVLSDLADWRPRAQSFASMGAFAYTQLPVRAGEAAFSPVTALMDPEFLPTLGNRLALGTPFEPTSYFTKPFEPSPAPGSDRTAILSHALWIEAFGGDRSVVGRTITVDGNPYVVRGVLAADFQFPRSDASYFTKPVDLLIPSSSYPNFPPDSRQWFGIARLKAGVTLARAEAELQAIAEGLSRNPATGDTWSVRLAPLAEETTRRARRRAPARAVGPACARQQHLAAPAAAADGKPAAGGRGRPARRVARVARHQRHRRAVSRAPAGHASDRHRRDRTGVHDAAVRRDGDHGRVRAGPAREREVG
jgi:putative ABC transport system permease protein